MPAKILALVLSLICFTAGAQPTKAVFWGQFLSAPITYQYPSFDYNSWLIESNYWAVQEITGQFTTFGGPMVWDGVSNVFRAVAQDSLVGTNIFQYTSADGRTWSDRSTALSTNGAAAYDAGGIGVPFIWNEVGQTRPWRMLYRGVNASKAVYTMCLATSTNGWNWERKDTAGTALTTCVITNSQSSDFGNVFKVGSTYYCYDDDIASPRKTYLHTSTDLVTWTKQTSGQSDNAYFWGATNVAGLWDYDDKTHASSGRASATFGFYCPWVGRWDKPDGTTEYRMYIATVMDSSKGAIVCFTSPVPDFNVTNRTYRGITITSANAHSVAGNAITDYDVPRVYCDDITQNPVTSTMMGSNAVMWVSGLAGSWQMALMSRPGYLELPSDNIATTGAGVRGVQYILPNTSIALHLALTGDTNTVYQFQPGQRKVANDLSGYGVDAQYPANGYMAMDANGILFTKANNNLMKYTPAAHMVQFDRVTNDFTLEFAASKATTIGAGNQACAFRVFAPASGKYVSMVEYNGTAGDTAGFWDYVFTHTSTSQKNGPAFDWSDNARHTWCFQRTNGILSFYKDGTCTTQLVQNASVDVQTTVDPLIVGSFGVGSEQWSGYIDELRLSACARYPTNGYTPATLPITYTNTGYIFSRVYDFGSSVPGATCTTYGTTPGGCSVTVAHRSAASATDKSTTVGDFGANAAGQWHQFLITLSGTSSATPTITGLRVTSP